MIALLRPLRAHTSSACRPCLINRERLKLWSVVECLFVSRDSYLNLDVSLKVTRKLRQHSKDLRTTAINSLIFQKNGTQTGAISAIHWLRSPHCITYQRLSEEYLSVQLSWRESIWQTLKCATSFPRSQLTRRSFWKSKMISMPTHRSMKPCSLNRSVLTGAKTDTSITLIAMKITGFQTVSSGTQCWMMELKV